MRRAAALATSLVVAGLLLTGCGPASETPSPTASTASGDALAGDITVFAAASLTGTFTEIADAFEDAHPGVHVTLNFAGS